MSSITDALPVVAPNIESFGAGGQMYMASIKTGFNLRPGRTINPLFAFNANSPEENAAVLTNLMETRKVGSTMAFRANRIGFRFVSFNNGVPTIEQMNELKQLLSYASIEITLGANETKVAEFSGLDLMQPIDMVAKDETTSKSDDNPYLTAASAAALGAGLGGGIGWIPLQIPIDVQANVNIGGVVRFGRSNLLNIGTSTIVPATDADPSVFGFVVILQGLKVVKS